ncbi:MAG: SpoIIE family protein phosphatase, partial [Lachnospiraceae bacterium]|nr:SpoIIE family protein phosphatase [Lachnospiraceae bacterium]
MGTSLLLAITVCVFGDLTIFGFNIKNILSILIVLILGWKNGMLIGATSGVMIGVTLGIIGGSEPILVASYAISGMIAGLFNRLGKIGVVIGFILGNVALTYVTNGNTVPIILFQEILIAFLGLLAVPKRVKIDIADFVGREKLLPETTITGRSLAENEDAILKLNHMSEAIQDMAKTYQEAASTLVSEEDLKQQELSNEQIFLEELRVNLQEIEENMLYETIEENQDGVVDDIFHYLLKEEVITERQLVAILEKHNNYIVGFHEKNEQTIEDVSKMIKVINSAYRMSKLNFIWKKKMQESKKNVATGLEGVSQEISHLAEEMKEEQKEDPFANKKQEIQALLKEKEIETEGIKIKQFPSGRYQVEIYHKLCDEIEGTKCEIKKIGRILNKVLGDKFLIQAQECGLRENKANCKFTYLSEDKYTVQIGVATSTKADSPVSGDSHTETKLEDGKYLVAISDGMGSGPEAMKSSKVAIKMLERLFKAGFDKETSLSLINSTLAATSEEDMYATLDIQILDLYSGNMEFIKSGACPTYVKRNKEVQILKAITLPAGILDKSDLIVYDYDLQEGDIIIMCSDGIIDANSEYLNKELWVKYLLEDIQTEDSQKIANLILEEAI